MFRFCPNRNKSQALNLFNRRYYSKLSRLVEYLRLTSRYQYIRTRFSFSALRDGFTYPSRSKVHFMTDTPPFSDICRHSNVKITQNLTPMSQYRSSHRKETVVRPDPPFVYFQFTFLMHIHKLYRGLLSTPIYSFGFPHSEVCGFVVKVYDSEPRTGFIEMQHYNQKVITFHPDQFMPLN